MAIPAEITVVDERMAATKTDSTLTVHFSAGKWLEGPSHSVQGRYLLFSDIPNDRTLRLDEVTGDVSVFDQPSRFANGRTHDSIGRLITCLQGERAVVRREHDGRESVIASHVGGRRLNSPNDVIASSAGVIWFTDPTYGLNEYEGHAAEPELDVRGLYRWSEGMSEPELACGDFTQPNGLAFSPDESTLYVVDSEQGSIDAFSVDEAGVSSRRTVVAGSFGFDGIRVDIHGRIWAATSEGVSCFDDDGVEMWKLAVPEPVSNLEFGGRQRNVLYLTATTSLYSIRTSVRGRA
ncbi:SMP-30/gluconolactonase/LRE family protein [Microbacterium lushaniae]|nr:SMP-30/gluconolactonase/LRE family protein [Microbacterium lushaniae]KAA9157716.1 SMP-30/gluconolactonase/LRE family protein [Microbacterium lushaniae]